MTATMEIDRSVYPDLTEPPADLLTMEQRADYVARICGAWDFDIVPTRNTFRLFVSWRDVFDRYPLADSPAYSAFRTLFRWPAVEGGRILQADYERIDSGRVDPCSSYW